MRVEARPQGSRACPASTVSDPSVPLIGLDALNERTDLLGVDTQSSTPIIDRLVAPIVAFARAYCRSPSSDPTRTNPVTGLRPSKARVFIGIRVCGIRRYNQ